MIYILSQKTYCLIAIYRKSFTYSNKQKPGNKKDNSNKKDNNKNKNKGGQNAGGGFKLTDPNSGGQRGANFDGNIKGGDMSAEEVLDAIGD